MSAFQIVITPTRKIAKKSVNHQPTIVTMAPFSAKSIVTFEDVPVSKTAKRYVDVQNPTEDELKVLVTKTLKPEYNLTIEWSTRFIPPNGCARMEMVWQPLKEFVAKETIQFTDNRNFRKDLVVIMKSKGEQVSRKGGSKPLKNRTIAGAQLLRKPIPVANPKLKLKSPSPHRLKRNRTVSHPKRCDQLVTETATTDKSKKSEKLPLTAQTQNHELYSKDDLSLVYHLSPNRPTGKENHIPPTTPLNISSIFNQFKFTPINKTITKTPKMLCDQMTPPVPKCSLICTPIHSPNHQNSVPRIILNRILDEEDQILEHKSVTPTFFSSTSINSDGTPNSESRRRLFVDKTYDLNRLSVPGRSTIQTPTSRNHRQIDSLSLITEEDSGQPNNRTTEQLIGITFNLSPDVNKPEPNLIRDVNLVGTPLRKKFQSMRELNKAQHLEQELWKNNQGSMPNLIDIQQSGINPIVNNRYYYQSSEIGNYQSNLNASVKCEVNTRDLLFNKNEICAQSSRINLNDRSSSTSSYFLNATAVDKAIVSDTKLNSVDEVFVVPKNTIQLVRPSVIRHTSIDNGIPSSITKSSSMKHLKAESFKETSYDTSNSMGRSFRVNSWSNIKPKSKFVAKIPQNLHFKSQPMEERVILFDSDYHINDVINPDPFAATTTTDPFLAATVYLDDHAISEHEIQFKKWLNALVTIPEEVSPNPNQTIDYGGLFNAVRNKDLSLAESKETVSSKYFSKYRMDGLRHTAIKLYRSDEMRIVLNKLVVYIERNMISIRWDRDLHLDIVLQRNILELLLNFNPLWLRIGLECVFGEVIPVYNHSDTMSISNFIINRMFKDPQFTGGSYRSAEYTTYIKKFTLKKFLFLLVFLDRAKNRKIIIHNPCLFDKKSVYKETKDILLRFSSMVLGKFGDITREMKRIGIVFTHKQTYIDEFDYAFRNLAVDLRDGIRLTRVMEIILLKDDMTQLLRAPAISRLQRLYNVELALKGLKEAGYLLTGDITASDIVDGHREKTLSLLWQIIYKFRAPKFNAAASVIQKWWRNIWLRVHIERLIRQKRIAKQEAAAKTIQSWYRGCRARKFVAVYRYRRTVAAICIQSYVRRYLAMSKFDYTVGCIIYIQRWYRGAQRTKRLRLEFQQSRAAAIKIQRWYRRHRLASKLVTASNVIRGIKEMAEKRYNACLVLQKHFRAYRQMKIDRNNFVKIRQATMTLQMYTRSYILMKNTRYEYLELKMNTIKIQQRFRANILSKIQRTEYLRIRESIVFIQIKFRAKLQMRIERKNYLTKRCAAISIQRWFRATLLMKQERQNYLEIRQKIITIQQYYRSYCLMKTIRTDYINLKMNVVRIQQRYRANCLAKKVRIEFETLKRVTINIQRRYRANHMMMEQRCAYLCLKQSCITIQSYYRAKRLMVVERTHYLEIRQACLTIQRRFRANVQRNNDRNSYNKLRGAAIVIQCQWRALLLMREQREEYIVLKRTAIRVQQMFRARIAMREQRAQYLLMKSSCIFIQRKLRATIAMKRERTEFQTIKRSVIIIQQKFRATILMREIRSQYLNFRSKVIFIQRLFRANKLMKYSRDKYLNIYQSTLIIQRKFRATIQRDHDLANYSLIRQSVIIIQRQWRAKILMDRQRNEYLKIKMATITIQRKWRATRAMRECRLEYSRLKLATILIQRHYRGNVLMKLERTNFLNTKNAVILIQRKVRATILMRRQRNEYMELKYAAITIQRRIRANNLMKIEREQYLKIQISVRIIQCRFRAILLKRVAQKRYLEIRQAVIVIQRQWRANLLRNKERKRFIELRSAVIIVQRRFRANMAMRQQRCYYQTLKQSSIIIQRRFRATLLMRKCFNEYFQITIAATIISSRWRATLAMRMERSKFVKLKQSTIVIQQHFRAIVAGRKDRAQYIATRQAVILIQQKFRATIQMRVERTNYLKKLQAIRTIQIYYRSYLLGKAERLKYIKLREACVTIQQRYRANILSKEISNQYQLIRCMIIYIQRKYRAKRAMKLERKNFLELKSAAIIIQRRFRAHLEMVRQKRVFLKLKVTTIQLQANCRGYLARQTFNAHMTPEMREMRRRSKAAILIQSCWRGYCVRRKRTKAMTAIAANVKTLTKTATNDSMLRTRISGFIQQLRLRFNIAEVMRVLEKMENISRIVPNTLVNDSIFITNFCYGILTQSIRSEADKPLILLCSRIILNLAKYEPTRLSTFNHLSLVTVAQMFLRWCDKDCGIFNTLCTVIWVFAQDDQMNQKIRSFMMNREALFMLNETKRLVLRKERMQKNITNKVLVQHQSLMRRSSVSRIIPSIHPDFGLSRNFTYEFNSSVFAFETIMAKLNINT